MVILLTNSSKHTFTLLSIAALLLSAFAYLTSHNEHSSQSLIVYCSHDSIFAEEIFQKFTTQTGIEVIPRYDTEASKSLGLTEKILREGQSSDCDVYWSNEMFSMAALMENKLLRSYKSKNWERIPEKYKDSNAYWCGFAARLRVIIYNTELTGSTELSGDFTQDQLSDKALALPLYGTTLTHFAALQKILGVEKLKNNYLNWQQKKIQIVPGNGPSRTLVANGSCTYAWTDTDDYFGAVDNKAPVSMLPARLPTGETIVIPNTVGILSSSKRHKHAQVFVDFLTSEQTEVALAHSPSRQIPLGPVTPLLPQEVSALLKYLPEAYDLKQTFNERTSLLKWLKEVHQLP
jgi:iron(III) transport system substrate-binding protein